MKTQIKCGPNLSVPSHPISSTHQNSVYIAIAIIAMIKMPGIPVARGHGNLLYGCAIFGSFCNVCRIINTDLLFTRTTTVNSGEQPSKFNEIPKRLPFSWVVTSQNDTESQNNRCQICTGALNKDQQVLAIHACTQRKTKLSQL